jgi:hypothetical protein
MKRILTIDGGGVRGAFAAAIVEQMERVNGGKRACEIFDCFCGTSAGSLLAAGLAAGHSASQLKELFVQLGESMGEGMRASSPGSNDAAKNRLSSTHALEQALRSLFGDKKGRDLERRLAVPARDMRTGHVVFFGNFPPDQLDTPSFWNQDSDPDEPVWLMVRRSAALPPMFEPDDGYVDGGISPFANPSYAAYIGVQRRLGWNPYRERLRFYSVGTGYHVQHVRDIEKLADNALYDKLIGAMMQDVNFLQHQVMKRRCDDGRIWYKRYNVRFDAPSLAHFNIDVPDHEILRSLGETASPHVKLLAEIGEAVGRALVRPADFEPLPPVHDRRSGNERRVRERRAATPAVPPKPGAERRRGVDRRAKQRRMTHEVQPADPRP